ncbi:MAG TPA: hypothetical protein VN802_03320 [Stellaceae bacterium]|nr:hypothetical protein [Stellaceae bacterium]
MAKHYRKMIVRGDHLEAPDAGPPWTVLWETKAPAEGLWSVARAENEQAALDRAAHFVRLGFCVHAIKDPTGAVFLDQSQIVGRFGTPEERQRHQALEQAAPIPE